MKKLLSGSPSVSLLSICFWCVVNLLRLVELSQAQDATNATTDPSEVNALNSMFQKWGVSAAPSTWNTTGDPCSGSAIDDAVLFSSESMNPGLKCLCNFNNGTTCHITRMRVKAQNATGPIPEELGNLTKLFDLDLAQNYLTGPLPAFIGNLTDMLYLHLPANALSGPLPKEIGKLQKLILLSIASNNFNGSLPPELGNLVNLEQLYMDSSGVGGEIPSTFSNLVKLKIMWASDSPFNGTIPNFIGSWNLTVLRLHGNSFEGPIPSSFANLTSLIDLRLSDVSNGSSTLDFITNMKSLSTLVMTNNMLSGSIPSSIGDYSALKLLDLSFNNLTGELPASLFNLNSLNYLFLGNNSLSGTLPSNKSSSLTSIDLSYNQLSGKFPLWVTEQGLQLNLVANNFIFDSSNNSVLPLGLDCLQRSFPCGRRSPIYSDFAINCGGNALRTSDTTYERDDGVIGGVASYYVASANNWAVSSVGRYVGRYLDDEDANVSYTRFTQQTFSNALNLRLFQSIRQSPVSLRYYGLGLVNGNYTVNLQFADIDFPDSATWKSVGRRVFDIYIQGSLQVKDFDIKKAAGGVTFKTVEEILKARVSDNYLEIHLLWAGKGTCCIPNTETYGPAIAAIKVTPDFIPSTSTKNKKIGLIVGISVSIGVVGVLSMFVFIWRKRSKMRKNDEDEDFLGMDSITNTFSYGELKTATEGFSPANKLGQGGFGPVYKGTIPDGRIVAVKQLSVASQQGKDQFVAEIAIISAVQHRNLVKLYGCCIEGDQRLLVYEYLENKSLDQALFGKSSLHLNWATRFGICLGTARGLAYLHEESRPRIVHRDVKASNILLDADLNPKISDFGLAKLYDDNVTHISTRLAGTIGYLAPEYAMRGHLTEKADVFAFGVVTLEILSGRPNSSLDVDPEKVYLLEWAWLLYENNCALELVDPALSKFNEGQATRMIGVALLCIQASPMLRPPMSRVIAMLLGDIEVSTVTTRPGYLTGPPFRDTGSSMSDNTSGASTSRNTNSQLTSSSYVSTLTHIENSRTNSTGPLPQEIVSNGQ